MNNDNNKGLNRRDFLKNLGVGAVSATAIQSCSDNVKKAGKVVGEMTYRINPFTKDKISLLGYGCMRWPLLENPAADGNVIDQDAVNMLIDHAMENGVNYYDTSPAYVRGWSEKATGTALKRHPRDKYYIATKLSNFSNYSRENSLAMYYKSFEDLQTDYIDYYLLHSIGGSMKNFNERYIDNGMLDFLIEERKAGRIRNLGFSFHGKSEVYDKVLALHDEVKWDFVQIQLNYIDWKHASGSNVNADYLYPELVKKNIPAVIMEPLLGGRLSKLPDHLVKKLKEQAPEDSVASWAFRFAGSPEGVLTVLSGMTYMEHLQDNIKTYSPLVPLSDDEKDLLEETALLMLKYPIIPCNDCQYCMPCPYGIDIAGVLLHYNRCINEGNLPTSSNDKNYREARRAFLVGYDRSVPKLRQSSHCTGCDKCTPLCPQGIDVPKELHMIDDFVETLKQGKPF